MAKNIAINYEEVTRAQSKASIVIQGNSGTGKSGLALLLAKYLAGDMSKVFALDTETKSLNLFDGIQMSTGDGTFGKFKKFDLLPSHGYAPSTYLLCRENAKKAGAEVFIQDSITHAWDREGGVLHLVEQAKKSGQHKYSPWGAPDVIEENKNIFDMFRDIDVHVISTIRVKEKLELVDGKMQSLGDQQIFKPNTKYEPDLVLEMVKAGNSDGTAPRARVIKSRYDVLAINTEYDFTEALCLQLKQYLLEGADPKEIQEKQRQDIIAAIVEILEGDKSKQGIWKTLKANIGEADTPVENLPLASARSLLDKLVE